MSGAIEEDTHSPIENHQGHHRQYQIDHRHLGSSFKSLRTTTSIQFNNAAKWSPPGADVEVVVRDGQLIVRDHGPGIADEDLPFVFDRFYRARAARGMPGSGLGLAIVRPVAESHGGEVVAERADGGGTRMVLTLGASHVAVGAAPS